MAKHVLTAITHAEAAGRPSINTGISMVGQGNDDFLCAHCSRQIITNFDMTRVPPDMVFVCGTCGEANGVPVPAKH
jgi:hypothetical protein